VADGPVGLRGGLAGDGDDLDDLLGGERGRAAGTRGVVEGLLDHGQQLGIRGAVRLGLPERVGSLQPAVAPQADGDAVEAEAPGHGLDAWVGGQREYDEDAADQPLRRGLAQANLLEQSLLPR